MLVRITTSCTSDVLITAFQIHAGLAPPGFVLATMLNVLAVKIETESDTAVM